LRTKVKGFHWLARKDEGGLGGEWYHVPVTETYRRQIEREAKALLEQEHPGGVHPSQVEFVAGNMLRYESCRRHGKVRLSRALVKTPEFVVIAAIAHELGHACTTQEDFEKRKRIIDDEWASESCADYYAYRWGFGREIRRHNKTRYVRHHGGLPGDIITVGIDDIVLRYRVTRNFYYQRINDE